MPVFKGTHFSKDFILKDKSTGNPIDITGWEFEAKLRDRVETVTLLTLTTANGGFVVMDGPAGKLRMQLTSEQTAALPVAKLLFDVLRTDADPGPLWLFGGRFPVRQPITRA